LSDDDLGAMAAFIKSLPPARQEPSYVYDEATTKALAGAQPASAGGTLYLGNCAACHGADGKGQAPYIPPLAGNPVVLDADPASLVNLVLNGAQPLIVKGAPDSYRMPQYRVQLGDDEVAAVLSFVRAGWGNAAPPVTADQVKALRPVTDPSSDRVIILKMR
jgi:mono/diheme cytochrome c family protein